MYNALNPIHYIALHNENEVLPMLTQNFGLPMPRNHQEYFKTVDYATAQFGDSFIDSMISIHPDRDLFKVQSAAADTNYVQRVAQYSLDQLNSELDTLTNALRNENTISGKVELLDTIAFVQKKIIEKQKQNGPTVASPESIHKTNQYLLLALVAVVLMFLGSKVFKQ